MWSQIIESLFKFITWYHNKYLELFDHQFKIQKFKMVGKDLIILVFALEKK